MPFLPSGEQISPSLAEFGCTNNVHSLGGDCHWGVTEYHKAKLCPVQQRNLPPVYFHAQGIQEQPSAPATCQNRIPTPTQT